MADQELEIDLRNVFAILRRQARLVAATVVFTMAIAVIYVFVSTPLYRAEALLLLDPSEQNLLDSDVPGASASATLNSRVDSEVEILRSPATALAMVEAANLISDPEFGPSVSTREKLMRSLGLSSATSVDGGELLKQVVARFIDARDVRRKGLTFVISVGVTSESPERAAQLANTLAEVYIARQVESKVASRQTGSSVLQGQIATAQEKLAQSEEQLDNYIFNNLDRLEAESGAEAIAELRSELEATQVLQETQLALSQDALSAFQQRDWASVASSLGVEALADLERERQELEARLGNAALGSSLAVDLQAALAEVEQGLEAQSSVRLQALQGEVRGLDQQIDGLRDDIRGNLLRSDLPSSTLAEIFTLQQEAQLSRNQYQTLLARLSELEAQAAVQIADSRIVSEALPPTSPSFPNKQLVLAIALVAALGVGTGLAFVNEFLIGGVTSESQLANILSGQVVGSIPAVEQDRASNTVADLVVDEPLSAYSESLRQIRAGIDLTLRKTAAPGVTGGRVILLTSAIPAEGKSTTALALARTYALAGTKTVLIDADLRKPALARQLGISNSGSFLDYLHFGNEDGAGASCFVNDPRSPLYVVAGDGRSDVPTDQIVNSERFRQVIDAARASSDIVIIDSSPVVPVVDARYIVPLADMVLFVARFGSTAQSDIRHAADQVRAVGGDSFPVLALLSQEERAKNSYKYQGYYVDYTT